MMVAASHVRQDVAKRRQAAGKPGFARYQNADDRREVVNGEVLWKADVYGVTSAGATECFGGLPKRDPRAKVVAMR